ncbi:MAG: Crp/Fnr family transcriptional regulator [Dehalococcoidia bacterium]|nr:Crp/Fnr family transcriptional regulator [Dehalococcoidia bacterium]
MATPAEKAALLRRVSMFEGLPEDLVEALAAGAIIRKFEPGEVVFREGEPAAGLHVVDQGWVRLVRGSAEGREQVLQFVGPGEPFNPLGAFSARPNPATAEALQRSRILVIDRHSLLANLENHPDLAMRMIEDMADRLVHLVGLVADLSLRPVTGRLARLLLESAEDGVVARQRWLTMAEIAARLGTVADVIQRAMSKLQADGIIKVSRREIRLTDIGRLREIAE